MNNIEEMLDELLEIALQARSCQVKKWKNALIEGLSGFGKTSITEQWAEEKGIPLVSYDLSQDVSTIYEENQFGILEPKKVEDPIVLAQQLIFSRLKKYKGGKDFILFLDDYHRALPDNIEAINYTIDTHKIVNPPTNEEIELDNLLFTVAIKTTGAGIK